VRLLRPRNPLSTKEVEKGGKERGASGAKGVERGCRMVVCEYGTRLRGTERGEEKAVRMTFGSFFVAAKNKKEKPCAQETSCEDKTHRGQD